MAAVALYAYGLPTLRISSIIEYFGYLPNETRVDYAYSVKAIDRGENALASNHLQQFSSAGADAGWYRGSILSSMKKEVQEVEVCYYNVSTINHIPIHYCPSEVLYLMPLAIDLYGKIETNTEQ